VAEAVRVAFAEVDGGPDATVLVFENSAGAGDGLGVDVAELAGVLEACVAGGVDLDRLGFCLDTAHAWGAGHRLDEPEGVDALLAEFDDRIGLSRLRMGISTTPAPSRAAGPTAMSTSAPGGSAWLGSAACSHIRDLPTSRTTSRPRAWRMASTP
jgi:hypothetical protein